jgi:hypothetical protein
MPNNACGPQLLYAHRDLCFGADCTAVVFQAKARRKTTAAQAAWKRRKCRKASCVDMGNRRGKLLTFDFERMPLEPSIHTYSAMTLPLCGRERYF